MSTPIQDVVVSSVFYAIHGAVRRSTGSTLVDDCVRRPVNLAVEVAVTMSVRSAIREELLGE